jgi:hypothetical protein
MVLGMGGEFLGRGTDWEDEKGDKIWDLMA